VVSESEQVRPYMMHSVSESFCCAAPNRPDHCSFGTAIHLLVGLQPLTSSLLFHTRNDVKIFLKLLIDFPETIRNRVITSPVNNTRFPDSALSICSSKIYHHVTPRLKNKYEANQLQMAFKKDGEAFGLNTTRSSVSRKCKYGIFQFGF